MKHKIRHLQSLVAVALCVIMAMAFASCSDDGDNEPEKPKVAKQMKSVGKTTFVYTDGKITKTLRNGELDDEFVYTESAIKEGSRFYYLNNGLVTKYVESDWHYEEFTYEDGRIKTWKKYSGGILDTDISFEWKDGVIVRQVEFNTRGLGNMKLFCDYQYSYTTYPDYGGAIVVFQTDSLFYDDLPEALIIQGFFGKWPKYLVSGAVDISGYFSKPESYTYILDSDGYPLSMGGTQSAIFSWENLD